jgi:DNA-binding CsgD family transcriptional regulator
MGTQHLTVHQKALVLWTYHDCYHPTVTAERLRVSIHQVVHHLKKCGIESNHGRPGVCHYAYGKIQRWTEEGRSLSEIARLLGTNKRTVKRFLQVSGIRFERFRQSGKNNPSWKGGRMIDKDGYVLIHQPEHPYASRHGYVREHRLVVEKRMGRFLSSKEVVHHKNGERQDNRSCNLELFESNGHHLAKTLKGKCPKWTEDGKRRIAAGHLPRKSL